MSGTIGLKLEEIISLRHDGTLFDYSSTVDIENGTGRQLEYHHQPAEATYSPGRIVIDSSLKLVRSYENRTDQGRLVSFGTRLLDEHLDSVDFLLYKFAFGDSKTLIRRDGHLRFKTTLRYKKGNPFRKWVSAWNAQPAWYHSIKDAGKLLFTHRFGLKVPVPGEFMRVEMDPSLQPDQTETLGDQILYWWGPMARKQALELQCRYSQIRNSRALAKRAIFMISGVVVKLLEPHLTGNLRL